jgi:hypothetical protein
MILMGTKKPPSLTLAGASQLTSGSNVTEE